ncbi:MAG: tetratricopeptide repeat protein, partial [Burkholderiaceae bacterium]|nr:tetratricopeptide repeat protein [Burkholderiaceae bacterium]
KVQINTQVGPGPQEALLRIRSAALIDEPVVTIYLRAGCAQKVTRRYVLLADLVTETAGSSAGFAPLPGSVLANASAAADSAVAAGIVGAPSSAARSPASATARSTAAERRRQRRAATAAAATSDPAASRTAAETRPAAAAARPASPRTATASVVRRQPEASRSRLKLDPLDLAAEREPTLRASSEMLSTPTDNAARRSEAAALWRAINAQPLDILRDAQRLQTLEADVKALRTQSAKTDASLKQLRSSLEQAESSKYLNWLVYLLVALLAAALGVAAWLWRSRQSRGVGGADNWWQRGARRRSFLGEDDLDLGLDEDFHSRPPSQKLARAGKGRTAPLTPGAVGVDVDLEDEPDFDKGRTKTENVAQPPRMPPRMDTTDFQVSLPGSPRAVNAEELFDIQQQADFFISLGQYDQAIEVLKNHISDNVETSALAYLDLLKIYHTLERRSDYDALREDFNKVFNAQVPEFENFSNQSSGLEAYQSALSRIEALWPSPKVLEIIEESIFRKPGSGEGEAFDLEAYRELLLLYAMAKDVVDRRSDMMDFDLPGAGALADHGERSEVTDFSATNIQPLSALIPRAAPTPGPKHSALGGLPMDRSEMPATRRRDILKDDPFLEDSTPTDSVPDAPMIDITFPDIAMPRPSPRLGLDIDLSEVADAGLSLADMPEPRNPTSDIPAVPSGVEIEMDPDFPFEPPAAVPQQDKAADSHLLDFDLFDPATEQDIAPKQSKLPKA